jgi:hypothetical protein
MVAHIYNSSYLGDRDQEDLKPAWTKSQQDLHLNKKAMGGGICRSSQLHGKPNRSPGLTRHKRETLLKK